MVPLDTRGFFLLPSLPFSSRTHAQLASCYLEIDRGRARLLRTFTIDEMHCTGVFSFFLLGFAWRAGGQAGKRDR